MRDFASCYNEHAVRVSDSSCSSGTTAAGANATDSSLRIRSVTCLYRTKLPGSATRGGSTYLLQQQHQLVLSVTWSHDLAAAGRGFSLGVVVDQEDLRSCRPPQPPTCSLLMQLSAVGENNRGKRSYLLSGDHSDVVLEVYWDISSARYETGRPEPVGGFYVAVLVDGELGLRLGDMVGVAHVVKCSYRPPTSAECFSSMIGRREQVVVHPVGSSGSGVYYYCTRSRLADVDGGRDHEIQIQFREGRRRRDDADAADECREWDRLCVRVDGKEVVHVRRLRWNFRGNQTIFVDGGAAVDMTWDVHGWYWFGAAAATPGCAAFMFRARGPLQESRPLWLEETAASKREQRGRGSKSSSAWFSLLIHAFKRKSAL